MSKLKNIFLAVTATVLFFGLLEAVSRLFAFPGSYDYIERRAIEQRLSRHKGAKEFRVFLFGESTMQGGALYPYSTIDKWMKFYLEDLLPEAASARVTIVNFGRLGASSRFTTTSFIDLLPYRPDLAVFYMAHNDFIQVGNRRSLLYRKPLMQRCEDFFGALPKKSSFLNLLTRQIIKAKIIRNKARDAGLSKIDRWYVETEDANGSPDDPANLLRPDSPGFDIVKTNFESNIKRTINVAGRHAVPVIFLESVSKWKDYEPVRSVHDPSVTGDRLIEESRIFRTAGDAFAYKRYDEALSLYNRCLDMDRRYALTYYRIGQCYENLGKFEKANEFYSLSNDEDHFPIRAPAAVNHFYEEIRMSGMRGVSVIQTQKLFEGNSPHGIIDDPLVIDQIHPSIEGQALMALEIVRKIYDAGLLAPREEWRWDRLQTVERMKARLNLDEEAKCDIYLSSAAYVKRHYARAAEFLEEALKIRPGSIFIRSWLAWTYWKLGEKARALDLYRQLYRDATDMTSKFLDSFPEIKKDLGIG